MLIAEFGFNPFMEYAKVRLSSPSLLATFRCANTLSQTVVAQQYDLERTYYYQTFLREMQKSMYEDGVNVIGALGWSFA